MYHSVGVGDELTLLLRDRIYPDALHAFDGSLTSKCTLRAYLQGDTSDFRCECTQLLHHGIDGAFQSEHFAYSILDR